MKKYPKIGYVVDGSTIGGNPGKSQYQIYDLETGEIILRTALFEKECTNNICEFLALCHGMLLASKLKHNIPVYSDSETAMCWVRNRKVNTNNENLKDKTDNAIKFLKTVKDIEVRKWKTKIWGENPADFGRK